MRAAIDLAEAGIHTYLLETSPVLGGRVAQLGFMFPTHDCVLCRGTSDHGFGCTRPTLSPAFLDENRHPNLTLLTSTRLLGCEGEAGAFTVHLESNPEYVDPALCTNCGRCAEVCPEERPSGFQLGMMVRKAIDKSAPRSVPDSYYLLDKTPACDDCRKCVEVCPTQAIDLQAAPRRSSLPIGAIILAMGFQPFDAALMPELGYGRLRNVITSMQYERMASRSGPTEGVVRRRSDGAVPKRIAWLQCVGSRDQRNPYCSTICCMYATKEAVLAKQRIPDVECHIFTMDERAFNKEYNQYYLQARQDHGVRYTRARISAVDEDPVTGEIILRYPGGREHDESSPGQGPVREERFDLLVLAVGIRPPAEAIEIAGLLGVELNEYGFCTTDKFAPLSTSRPGVFVCGAFASPKEIAETILDASGAAAEVMRLLPDQVGQRVFSRSNPYIGTGSEVAERVPAGEGVDAVLCGCMGEISDVVDLASVAGYLRRLPGIGAVEVIPAVCRPEGRARLAEVFRDGRAGRVVIGACSPRTHEPLFQRLACEAGINPYLVETVNLREQCSWVHASDPVGATRKASELMRVAVGRVRRSVPIHKVERAPHRAALVIGGGASGMTAALAIAETGFDVHLVEKTGELGGNLHHVYYVAEGDNPQRLLPRPGQSRRRSRSHSPVPEQPGDPPLGQRRRFRRHGQHAPAQRAPARDAPPAQRRHPGHGRRRGGRGTVPVGPGPAHRAPVRTGGDPRPPPRARRPAALGRHAAVRRRAGRPRILLAHLLHQHPQERAAPEDVEPGLPGGRAVQERDHLRLPREVLPGGPPPRRDLRALHRRRAARRAVGSAGARQALVVRVHEHVFGKTLAFEPDLLALSMAIVPPPDSANLARLLNVPLSSEGFFLEAHLKMRPMEFHDEGMLLAGMAHYPKFIEESITHALACAGRALTILSRPTLQLGGVVAEIDPAKCTGCLTCARTCPFSIPQIRADLCGVGGLGGAAWIDPARCQGCGTCTAECPARAIQLKHYTDDEIRVAVGAWEVPLPVPGGD